MPQRIPNKVQVIKVFVTQPSSASCYFLLFGPNTIINLLPNTFTPHFKLLWITNICIWKNDMIRLNIKT